MELKVADAWDSRENRQAPRPQGGNKQAAVDEQCNDMLKHNVIVPSKASAHSQVHLTRKTDGTYRFCVDFRRLNLNTKPQTWPLPNIQEMFERIGRSRPKFFAVFDCTKGYYQCPLSESSQHYTAFITAKALYNWKRVPMGLQGASAYYMRTMTTVVLPGLLYNGVDCYLDDIIVYSDNEADYLHKCRQVLERFRKFGITVNPKKCKLGQDQVEYVGHMIDCNGLEFKRERLQEIIDFPRPNSLGELKTFLGLATYVRKNTSPKAAEKAAPLNDLLKGYTKKKKNNLVRWTQEAIQAFEDVKTLVNASQKLFFYNPDASAVHLYTDASQYGIGSSLIQIVDGVPQVISFMSHTLNSTQKNWSTIEKEGFAIYESVRKFEYLIRDTHFTLHTDHKNLIYIRDTGSPKVMSWKLLLQEFDYEACFIKGEDNAVADLMSRNPAATVMPEGPADYKVTDLDAMDLGETPRPLQQNQFMSHVAKELHLPTQQQYDAMKSCHNEVVGHNGLEPTVQRLKAAGYDWQYMRPMVTKFIRECDACQKAARGESLFHVKPFTLSGWGLMKDRSIDFVGPLSPDEDGNTYIGVIIDTFSRWVELYKCKAPTAECGARCLLEHYGDFGLPTSVRSDRGAAFTSKLITEFMTMLGVNHILSIADSHQENGIVEAANAEVRRYLNDIGYDRQLHSSHWSESLPFAKRIQNSLVKSLTGFSPAYLLYAGGIDLNQHIIPAASGSKETVSEDTPLQPWISERLAAQHRAIKVAEDRVKAHEEAHQQTDTGLRTEFAVGSLVLRDFPPSAYGNKKPNKSVLKRQGPFQVISFQEQTYILRDMASGKELPPVNIHRLRPYQYDSSRTNPVQIRTKDRKNQFIVEEILGHTGHLQRKKSLLFKVLWEGHDEPTEEKWENVYDCSRLHDYLRDNNLSQYIPDKFQLSKKQKLKSSPTL